MLVKFKTTQTPINYLEAMDVMNNYIKDILENNKTNMVWFLEHHNVYTQGTSSNSSDILLNKYNIPIINTQRGGQITFHGPGQRVIYLMLKLKSKDVSGYINTLQNWIIEALEVLGVSAYTLDGNPGVWVKINNSHQKIAAIGIRIKKWIAYHGVAINVNTNLIHFNNINPCGLNFKTTSLHQMGIDVSLTQVDDILKNIFTKHFQLII